MPHFDPLAEYNTLLCSFAQHCEAAKKLEGDLFVSLAFVGFTLQEQADQWGQEQVLFILDQRSGELSDESLNWYEEDAPCMASFGCLALGMLLSAYSRGMIDDVEFLQGQFLLPGFLSLNDSDIAQVCMTV